MIGSHINVQGIPALIRAFINVIKRLPDALSQERGAYKGILCYYLGLASAPEGAARFWHLGELGWVGEGGEENCIERQRTEGEGDEYQLSMEPGHSGRGPARWSIQHSCCRGVTEVPHHSLYVLQRDLLWLGACVDPLLDVQGRESERRAAFHLYRKALLEHVAAALEEIGSGERGPGPEELCS